MKQTCIFDRFGNRNFDESNTTTLPNDCTESGNPVVCEAIRPIVNPSVNTSDNRLNGYTFDAAGNTVRDAQNRKFTYDAENKQVKVETVDGNGDPIATIGEYFYDGDGKRIKKIVPATDEVTVFVYNASGQLVAEYSTEISQDPKVSYTTADHLGSPRILTDENGATISRRDFHPFGEEVFTSERTAGLGYTADDVRQKFTSYERDTETDLDYAQARYFNYEHGRFSSADPTLESVALQEPQTWNRYVYVTNNPLRFIDPLGLWKLQTYYLYTEEEYEEDGERKKRYVLQGTVVVATKSKEGDNAESLLKQLGIDKKSAEGKALLESIGSSDSVRLGALGGEVGESFSLIENLLGQQREWEDAGNDPRTGPAVKGFENCAETCLSMAFPGRSFTGDFYSGPQYTDSQLAQQQNISESELRFKDAIRYADRNNKGLHYANFVFRTDEGNLTTFSRSGLRGRLELIDSTALVRKYGAVQGIGTDRTGYYSRKRRR